MAGRRRKTVRWAVGGAAVVVVLAVGGPFVYIHFIEGAAPAKLTLPSGAGSSSSTTTTAPDAKGQVPTTTSAVSGNVASAVSTDGTWKVGAGSTVGYRVQEVLVGQQSTAVGRTTKVWGSLAIAGKSATGGTFTAEMASVVSDQSERNAQFDGRIMDVSAYPTATFELTSPIRISPVAADGVVKRYPATGELTMHGVSKPVTFTVSAERSASTIYVLADIRVVFANWGISNPSVGGFVTTQDYGTLEVLLHLTRGAGNPAVSGSAGVSSPNGGGGGPVTVPSTTVPTLTVPTS